MKTAMGDSSLPAKDGIEVRGQCRVVISSPSPVVEAGRFAVKRTLGDAVEVEADILGDGHDTIAATLLYRHESDVEWRRTPLEPLVNDRWRGTFRPDRLGRWLYTIEAWVDRFASWRQALAKRRAAGQDLSVSLLVGVELIKAAMDGAGSAGQRMRAFAELVGTGQVEEAVNLALSDDLAGEVARWDERRFLTRAGLEYPVEVERERARFSTWYELFPRSCAGNGLHGTFRDVEDRLPYIAKMGFDVVYLPPIHPIGVTSRKGRNNTMGDGTESPGSPWAIGSKEGGHKAIHPDLGTLADFRSLIEKAKSSGLELAMDIAFQCSPDHPYVRERPDWFRHRPDGTVQYAENPPKRYEDIFPFDFEADDWTSLWIELRSVLFFWIEQGVRIFRVDNPHTKPFVFWEWLLAEVKRKHPDTVFLSEAFTRPKVMYRLARLGFSQSYTYFTWRNSKEELITYFSELTRPEVQNSLRPCLWPNTPDILPEFLQTGGRPAFMTRLVLAATLGANYGIYGPAFELQEREPLRPGEEEYLNSEKYEIRTWDLSRVDSLAPFIGRVNRIRRENPALQSDRRLHFHRTDNPRILCYSKTSEDGENSVVVAVNLDPHQAHGGWIDLDLEVLGLDRDRSFQLHDLLGDARHLWHGGRNYVHLAPQESPAAIYKILRKVRSEQQFDYYL